MSRQVAFPRRSIITLAAFVGLFSTMRVHMCPQIESMSGCIVALVAFVCLFSTVRFQMCPRIAFPRECIVTLIVFVWHRQVTAFKILHLSWRRKETDADFSTHHY